MAGRGNEEAQQASKSGLGYSRTLQGQQGSLYGTLAPAYSRDIANPVGLSPNDKARMNTAAMESEGGANAGAVGQSALQAARTRNAGGADAAIQESAREAGRGVTRAGLGTELADTELKQRKEAAAKEGMGQLYGISTHAGNEALGQVAENVKANSTAEEQSWNWAKFILDPALQAGGTAAAGLLSKCWIAEVIYGVDDTRTHLIRAWLNGPFERTLIGSVIGWLYSHFGRWIAARPQLALRLKPLFDRALDRAMAEL